jgi:hypothetical protein
MCPAAHCSIINGLVPSFSYTVVIISSRAKELSHTTPPAFQRKM